MWGNDADSGANAGYHDMSLRKSASRASTPVGSVGVCQVNPDP